MNIHPLTHKLLNLEGETFKHVTFNGTLEKDMFTDHVLSGYWEYKDGSEGGDLELWANKKDNILEVNDFDGAYDLPSYVKEELKSLGVTIEEYTY